MAPPADAFNVGRFAPDEAGARLGAVWRLVTAADDAAAIWDAAEPGDRLARFGFCVVVSRAHLRARQLEPLRARGDPLADAAYAAWRAAAAARGACPARHTGLFTQLEAEAAAGGGVEESGPIHALLAAAARVPPWVDFAAIARAQRTHWRHALGIGTALLNLALVGGFGSPRINAVLACTGYLTADSGALVHRRLLETLAMVVACFDGGPASLMPRGAGWRAVLDVRLLHASVRARLLRAGGGCPYDAAACGVPINQEDLVVTQLAFSLVVLMGLERAGCAHSMTERDMADYLHTWRWIGCLMGIDDTVNQHMGSLRAAQAMLESIAWHTVAPNAASEALAKRVLAAVAGRPPLPWTLQQHAAVTRALAGDAYADALGIPRTTRPPGGSGGGGGGRWRRGRSRSAAPWWRWLWRALSRQLQWLLLGAAPAPPAAAASNERKGGDDDVDDDGDDDGDNGDAAFAARVLRAIAWVHWLSCAPLVGALLCAASRAGVRRLLAAHLPGGRASFAPRDAEASAKSA